MKTIQFFFLAVLFSVIFIACQKDDITQDEMDRIELRNGEEPQMVPFKGDFQTPPISTEMIDCIDDVTGYTTKVAVNHLLIGNATHLGKLDETSSFITTSCDIDLSQGIVITEHEITFLNKNGDGLKFFGSSTILLTGEGEGYFEVVEGYGKFENASGWIETKGNIAVEGGPVFSADGMITQPNQ